MQLGAARERDRPRSECQHGACADHRGHRADPVGDASAQGGEHGRAECHQAHVDPDALQRDARDVAYVDRKQRIHDHRDQRGERRDDEQDPERAGQRRTGHVRNGRRVREAQCHEGRQEERDRGEHEAAAQPDRRADRARERRREDRAEEERAVHQSHLAGELRARCRRGEVSAHEREGGAAHPVEERADEGAAPVGERKERCRAERRAEPDPDRGTVCGPSGPPRGRWG